MTQQIRGTGGGGMGSSGSRHALLENHTGIPNLAEFDFGFEFLIGVKELQNRERERDKHEEEEG